MAVKVSDLCLFVCCVSGDPSAKELEQLLSLSCFSSQGSQARSSWSHSGLKTKRGSSKQERRKISDRRGGVWDSPHAHRRDSQSKAPETKDTEKSEPSETASEPDAPNSDISQDQFPDTFQETTKLHKPENRKVSRREAEHEVTARRRRDEEERRRKRKSDVVEGFQSQTKNKLGSKHLEKTVSIRLVDIRSSDNDDYFMEEGTARRNPAPESNGWPRKANGSHTPSRQVGGYLRGWGKFRIPKRNERPLTAKEEEEEEASLLLPHPINTPNSRSRLRASTESDGYASDSKAGDGEMEPCLKRCHSHQLRGEASLARRYGSDIIRRGVLAS